MPQGDQTGPQGLGPRTGCEQGACPDEKETNNEAGRPRLGLRGTHRQRQGKISWLGRFRSNRNQDA